MRTKKYITFRLAGLTILLLLLCGCAESSPVQTETPEVCSFVFRHRGMSSGENYLFSVIKTEDEILLRYEELFYGGIIVEKAVGEDTLERLETIIQDYDLKQWDGFHKTSRRGQDGSGFSLEILLEDGTAVSADGSGIFPSGYSEVEQAILASVEPSDGTVSGSSF